MLCLCYHTELDLPPLQEGTFQFYYDVPRPATVSVCTFTVGEGNFCVLCTGTRSLKWCSSLNPTFPIQLEKVTKTKQILKNWQKRQNPGPPSVPITEDWVTEPKGESIVRFDSYWRSGWSYTTTSPTGKRS